MESGLERQLAVQLFNHAWALMGLEERTPEQDDELIHTAHASRYHWGNIGRPENLARGEWQCSRVYAVLGRSAPALWHGQRCLEICEANGLADFDLAYAYEALARGHRVAGDEAEAARLVELSREAGKAIEGDDDRELLAGDLAALS